MTAITNHVVITVSVTWTGPMENTFSGKTFRVFISGIFSKGVPDIIEADCNADYDKGNCPSVPTRFPDVSVGVFSEDRLLQTDRQRQ